MVHLLDNYVVSCAAVGDTPRWDVFYLFAESEVRTLADILEEHRRLGTHIPEERVLRIGIDVVDAVAFLHQLRPPLLHRDIRLSSVVETLAGSFKLFSFIGAAFPLAYGFSQDQLSAVYEDLECFTNRDCRSPEMTEVQYEEGVTEKSGAFFVGLFAFRYDWTIYLATIPFLRYLVHWRPATYAVLSPTPVPRVGSQRR